MKTFTQFLESENVVQQAVTFLHLVTLASRNGAMPSDEVLTFLSQTAKGDGYKLFRGLSIANMTKQEAEEFYQLKAGDEVPERFLSPSGSQVTLHATKSRAVAESYSQEGVAGLVIEFDATLDQVICDTTNLTDIIGFSQLDDMDDWEYFAQAQEVLLYRDSVKSAKVVMVAGPR